MEIRRFARDDGPLLAGLRLRALADSPHAFASSLAQERERPPQIWEERARAGAEGEGQVGFFVFDGEQAIGMVRAYLDVDEEPDAAHLIAMWVDPLARGRGAGRALTEAVLGWARERGARIVKLWVTTTNPPAVALYLRCGFRRTGVTEPLPSDPSLTVERLEREP